jgi:hypothetical protein
MAILSCPYCNKKGLSLFKKFCLSPGSSVKCQNCGENIGLPSGKYIISMLPISISIFLSMMGAKFYVFIIAVILMIIMVLGWVPIVKKDSE